MKVLFNIHIKSIKEAYTVTVVCTPFNYTEERVFPKTVKRKKVPQEELKTRIEGFAAAAVRRTEEAIEKNKEQNTEYHNNVVACDGDWREVWESKTVFSASMNIAIQEIYAIDSDMPEDILRKFITTDDVTIGIDHLSKSPKVTAFEDFMKQFEEKSEKASNDTNDSKNFIEKLKDIIKSAESGDGKKAAELMSSIKDDVNKHDDLKKKVNEWIDSISAKEFVSTHKSDPDNAIQKMGIDMKSFLIGKDEDYDEVTKEELKYSRERFDLLTNLSAAIVASISAQVKTKVIKGYLEKSKKEGKTPNPDIKYDIRVDLKSIALAFESENLSKREIFALGWLIGDIMGSIDKIPTDNAALINALRKVKK